MGIHARATVVVLVSGGLVASIISGVFLIDGPVGELPGVALGSEAILAVERAVGLFAAWLLTDLRSALERLDGEVEGLRKGPYAERGNGRST